MRESARNEVTSYSELKEQGSRGPFEVRCRINVHSANGTFTFNTYNEADAKLVTHVLNNFDQLLEALERYRGQVDQYGVETASFTLEEAQEVKV